LALLPEQTLESLRELLSEVSRSGCLIRLYALSAEQDQRRAKMIEELKALSAQLGGTQATKYLEFLLQQVEITEGRLPRLTAQSMKTTTLHCRPASRYGRL
jgi:hypothetical protein